MPKPPTALWQIKEAKKLDQTSSRLAKLALNTETSNAAFYRAAIFEAVNIDQRRKARDKRARAAGQRVEGDPVDPNEDPNNRKGGIEVLNKDTIDPQTAKRLGQNQVDHILHLCKRHKELVDTATASIDNNLNQRWMNRLASTKLQKQRKLIKKKRRLAAKRKAENAPPTAKGNGAGNMTQRYQQTLQSYHKHALDGSSSVLSTVTNTSRTSKSSKSSKTSKKSKTVSSSTSATKPTSSKPRPNHQPSTLPTQYIRDELPELNYPLTLKNYSSRRQVEGWKYDQNKLNNLIKNSKSAIDMTEPRSRIRAREDVDRKRKIALQSGAGDPDDIRPGEYGMSFAQKAHWRLHLEQLNELIETAPGRTDAKIDHHVERIWNLNRERGQKDIDKSKGCVHDFALTLKRDATKEQIRSWDGAITQLNDLTRTAVAKIDNDWGPRGPPRSIKGGGQVQIPSHSVASRHGNHGVDPYGRSNVSNVKTRLPQLSADQPQKLRGEAMRAALKKKLGKNQISVAHVDGLENTEGLGLAMQVFLGGKSMLREMAEKDELKRRRRLVNTRRRWMDEEEEDNRRE